MVSPALAEGELLELARRALAEYDVPWVDLRPIRLTNNAVFEVSDAAGSRLALRIHRPAYRTLMEIRSELEFLRALAAELRGTRIDVPRPLPARGGDLVARAGPRHCVLFEWIEGRVLRPGEGLGARSTFLMGEALARIHAAAQRFEPPTWFELPRWDAATIFSPASPFRSGPMDEFLSPEAWAVFRRVAERTAAAFDELDHTPEPWGIVHADFILLNCHFGRRAGSRRLGVLDFDDLGWGYFLFDLAPLLGNLADYPDSYARHRRALLAGYRSIRPLHPDLEVHLPVLMAARHALVLTWLAGMHRRGRTDLRVDRHIEYRVGEMQRLLAT